MSRHYEIDRDNKNDQDLNGIDIKTLGAGNTKFGYYPNNGPSDGFY